MADDIYINTGTTFQQQYTARVPANAQQPVSGQVPARQPANSQNPFTYANRNPFTYRSPVSSQTPTIANAQQPYPYIANGQTPFIANAQAPFTYARQGRTPAIYQHPFTYARQAQAIVTYQHPTTYARQGQTPTTYQNRQPSTYSNRQPNIYQNPYPYIGQARQPSTYQHRTPTTYRNPLIGRAPYPYIANAQSPIIAGRQNAYPYIANARTPLIGNERNPAIYQSPYSNQNTTSNSVLDTDNTTTAVDMATLDWKSSGNGYMVNAYAELVYRLAVTISGSGATAQQTILWQIKRGNDSFDQMLVHTFHDETGNVDLDTSFKTIATQVIVGSSKFADSAAWISDATYPKITNETHSGNGGYLHTETDSGAAMDTFHAVTTHLSVYDCTHRLSMNKEENGQTTCDLNWIWTPTLRKAGFPDLAMDSKHNAFVQGWLVSTFCFPAGTQVLLENNTTKNIESMVVGDRVIGQDGVINEVIELVATNQRDRTLYTINGDIQTIPAHPFLTTAGWKAIDVTAAAEAHPSLGITQLAIGDFVVKTANDGTVSNEEVTTLTSATENIIVYNLDVTDSPAGNDTYVVNNYVVHNK